MRIAYNNLMPFFDRNLQINSIEGFLLRTFINKYRLSVEWRNGDMSWGAFDPKTGKFNGIVGLVSFFFQNQEFDGSVKGWL